MTSITFDSLSAAKRLKAKGIPQEQAEAFAEELRIATEIERDLSHLASKADLAELKAEILKFMLTGFLAIIGLLVAILFKLH